MNKKLADALCKVIAALGWADGKLTSDEVEHLKDLLFQFQRSIIDPREDAKFDMYVKSPVDAAERDRLVEELREKVWSTEDKTFVLSALQKMVEADGKITAEEQAIMDDLRSTLGSADTGFLGDLGKLIQAAVGRRSQATRNAPNREKHFEDFLKNKVYYEVRRRLDLGDAELKLPDAELRKLSVVGGFMARVAQTDGVVLEKETDRLTSVLGASWGLSRAGALFVMECAMADVSKDFDYLRMARELIELATPQERIRLLDLLFSVANADGHVSNEELLEITYIADYLLISLDRVNRTFLQSTDSQSSLPSTDITSTE
jgi:uncharacterized tellurite resistance protein B-like protein